jgi:hypothetical protein
MVEWILVASSENKSFVAQTNVNNSDLVYRAVSKWLIRGSASDILQAFWEYIDQYDNELEDALLEQLLTQAEKRPKDPQVTNVRNKDYSIDMTVHAVKNSSSVKMCKVQFVLYVYFSSLKQQLKIDEQYIDIHMIQNNGTLEKVEVVNNLKTPHHLMTNNSKRVQKRSSKESL